MSQEHFISVMDDLSKSLQIPQINWNLHSSWEISFADHDYKVSFDKRNDYLFMTMLLNCNTSTISSTIYHLLELCHFSNTQTWCYNIKVCKLDAITLGVIIVEAISSLHVAFIEDVLETFRYLYLQINRH